MSHAGRASPLSGTCAPDKYRAARRAEPLPGRPQVDSFTPRSQRAATDPDEPRCARRGRAAPSRGPLGRVGERRPTGGCWLLDRADQRQAGTTGSGPVSREPVRFVRRDSPRPWWRWLGCDFDRGTGSPVPDFPESDHGIDHEGAQEDQPPQSGYRSEQESGHGEPGRFVGAADDEVAQGHGVVEGDADDGGGDQ